MNSLQHKTNHCDICNNRTTIYHLEIENGSKYISLCGSCMALLLSNFVLNMSAEHIVELIKKRVNANVK